MKSSVAYLKYVDIGFEPDPSTHVIASYRACRAPASHLEGEAFLGAVAAESSTGTWIDVSTRNARSADISGRVFFHDAQNEIAKIAYPCGLFEAGNISQLLTVVAGNAFGLADLRRLKLVDLQLPESLARAFPGPAFGAGGIWKALGIGANQPVIGAIIKPKCGLSADEHARVAYDAWIGEAPASCDGVDMVKDDEACTSQSAVDSDFYRRVEKTLAMKQRAESLTGRRKIYVPNVTHSNFFEALRRAEFVRANGGEAVMVDYVIAGCSLLHALRFADLGLIIHGHRTLFAALHRPADFGIDYMVWAKLFRLIGGDQVHTGTPALGVMSANRNAVLDVCRAMREPEYAPSNPAEGSLPQPFFGAKAVAPICGAGLDPLTTAPLTDALGTQVVIFAGGGVHGHPHGTRAGAAAMRESVQAVLEHRSLAARASESERDYLRTAVSFFGKFDKQSPNDGERQNL
ncbi:ribulose-bisphosphate carboxylase large subunit [Trinickia terrae]|uniref:Ribulose-bisphosphate carboxylase large subunit n=1 Tax=Trinickia terrae TaxID=2571161 RepID=A0A4U1HNY4_9BURK|nr:RuBisCO large subunit C-terminal-like domain-containing protein [Trinickia terrae]TKC83089.1 ribulose-bisphosphate carboxylase large subunit [Trinickia terrae]